MRIAVVADVHGNVRALRAVMDDIKTVSPDTVVNLGDCVSGPLEAAETCDVLISLAWTTIRGNHDRQLIDRPIAEMGASDQAAASELKNHHSGWLSALEPTVELEDLLLCHGTPDNDSKYLLETVEPDGRVRIVIAEHPLAGLSGNWIDSFGHDKGQWALRFVQTQVTPPVKLWRLPLADLEQGGAAALDPTAAIDTGQFID